VPGTQSYEPVSETAQTARFVGLEPVSGAYLGRSHPGPINPTASEPDYVLVRLRPGPARSCSNHAVGGFRPCIRNPAALRSCPDFKLPSAQKEVHIGAHYVVRSFGEAKLMSRDVARGFNHWSALLQVP
jgi:hypothetical protein